jgi:hypothetical protein
LVSHRLGALPLINHFLDRIGLDAALGRWLPEPDRRFKLTPATAIRLLVVNLLVGRAPLYGMGEWAAPYAPGLLGLPGGDTAWLNDDRVGRALVALFDADRASLLTDLIVGVVAEFNVDTAETHNDSTSVSVHGDYRAADGRARRGKPTAAVTFGHSKDHRPGLKQLVWILTVSADGSVPMAYRLADGNTSDDPTHIPTWDTLVKSWTVETSSTWPTPSSAPAKRCTTSTAKAAGSSPCCPALVVRTSGSGTISRPTGHSGQKRSGCPGNASGTCPGSGQCSRPRCPGVAAIDTLNTRLTGPKTRLKTRQAVQAAADTALADTGGGPVAGGHHRRDRRGQLPAGEPRPARRPDPLPAHHPHPLHRHLEHP